ncbi:hypothetical protein ERJ75_001624400 [Trypanosoma vivax]|nr:hypothetical protein ERJ75_001624400 [Trypanosoma vivax]
MCVHGTVDRCSLCAVVRRRGPDALSSVQQRVNDDVSIEAVSAVLCLRRVPGGEVVVQPSIALNEGDAARSGNHSPALQSFLQWNGEVFGGCLQLSAHTSDTVVIRNRLRAIELECAAGIAHNANSDSPSLLAEAQASFSKSCIKFLEYEVFGPYSFVYHAHSLNLVLFGRDPLGRRSLLVHLATEMPDVCELEEDTRFVEVPLEVVISSVAAEHSDLDAGCGTPFHHRKRCRCTLHCDHNVDVEGGDDNEIPANSCSCYCCWEELPNTGIFALNLSRVHGNGSVFTHYSWKLSHGIHPLLRFQNDGWTDIMSTGRNTLPVGLKHLLYENNTLSHELLQDSTPHDVRAAVRYLRALWEAVSIRVCAEARGDDSSTPVGILFSGGIDCTVLAAIAHYILPLSTPIELINVAFGDRPELTPDRLATFSSLRQLLQLPAVPTVQENVERKEETGNSPPCGGREWRLVLTDASALDNETVRRLIFPCGTVMDMSIGMALWHAAKGRGRMQRIRCTEGLRAQLAEEKEHCACYHKFYRLSTVGDRGSEQAQKTGPVHYQKTEENTKFIPLIDALVSELEAAGGESAVDPVLLSTLGKDYADTLRPVLMQYGYKKLGQYLNDAVEAGIVAFARKNETPSKAVRLVRPGDIARVRCTGFGEWLQTKGPASTPLGECINDYTCMARVVLLGIGADETLGGYTRHRRAFERRGVRGLAEELNHDFARLWKRNLGRDDRVVSDSGREGRYPYLDEGVLATLSEIAAEAYQRMVVAKGCSEEEVGVATKDGADDALQHAISSVCCFTLESGSPGMGDKKILRRCAAMLGLGDVVWLQKRAIQFGSRVAHTQN